MVNNLLDFSRLEGGKLQALFRPTKLSSVTADLGSLFRSAIERGAIEYIVDCEPDPSDGPAVFLSVELWEKIIFNLVGNAFKVSQAKEDIIVELKKKIIRIVICTNKFIISVVHDEWNDYITSQIYKSRSHCQSHRYRMWNSC